MTDHAGHHGDAVSLTTAEFGGRLRETLILDPRTGQLLSFEETVVQRPTHLPYSVGAVLSYTGILNAGYVDNTTSTP